MRLFFKIILFAGLLISNTIPAAAQGFSEVGSYSFTWEGIFASGRLSALGGSDLADGSPASVLINPAPLARPNGIELGYDHADYFRGVEIITKAASAQWNAWRLNVAVQDFAIDDVLVRTAYNPEGTGETFDILDRMTVMGLSYDLGNSLFDMRTLRWSVGGALRHYSYNFIDFSESADSFDLGTTVRWARDFHGGWTNITGAISWQNISDTTVPFDDKEAHLPRPLRFGVTMETAFDWAGHQGNFLKVLLAYTHCHQMGDTYVDDSEHIGLESVFFDTFAIRWGHSSRVTGDIGSWGIGLILDGRLLGPFTVHADMGEMGYNNILTNESETIWGLRVGYNF